MPPGTARRRADDAYQTTGRWRVGHVDGTLDPAAGVSPTHATARCGRDSRTRSPTAGTCRSEQDAGGPHHRWRAHRALGTARVRQVHAAPGGPGAPGSVALRPCTHDHEPRRHLAKAASGRPGWLVTCATLASSPRYWSDGVLKVATLQIDTEMVLRGIPL